MSAYKSWEAVIIIQFSTSTNYIKLTQSNTYNTLTGQIYYKIRDSDGSWNDVVKVLDTS